MEFVAFLLVVFLLFLFSKALSVIIDARIANGLGRFFRMIFTFHDDIKWRAFCLLGMNPDTVTMAAVMYRLFYDSLWTRNQRITAHKSTIARQLNMCL